MSLARVVRREAERLRQLPALWALLLPIPVAATLLLIGILNADVPRQLPVGVLDFDRTPAAQTAARWLEATRSARVTARVDDLGAARALLLEGEVYAVLVIPRHFERDLLRGRSPHVTLLYNQQSLTAGNLIVGDVTRAANTAAAALAARTAAGAVPILVDAHVLFNPGVNSAHALGLLLIGGILQIVIAVTTIYAIGRELADATVRDWLAAAGGSSLVAWVGKLIPYSAYYCLLVFTLMASYVAWFQMPVRGHPWMVALSGAAFVFAVQGFSVLLVVLIASLGSALGAGSFLFAPAAAFSGVSFPLGAMPVLARGWAEILPLTHLLQLLRAEILVGAPLGVAGGQLLALGTIGAVALVLARRRMAQVLRVPALWGRP